MKCVHCGADNEDTAINCSACGNPLIQFNTGSVNVGADAEPTETSSGIANPGADAGIQTSAPMLQPADDAARTEGSPASGVQLGASAQQPAQEPAQQPAQQPALNTAQEPARQASQGFAQQAAQPSAYQPAQQATTTTSAFVPPSNAAQSYKRGCVGAALDDIGSSKGWFGRISLLGLINIVPILNFVVEGYSARWGADLSDGKIQPLPKRIFQEGNFKFGFFIFVIFLILEIAYTAASAILGFIPFIGNLIMLAACIFVYPFASLACMRMVKKGTFGAAFKFGSVWNAYKAKPGSALFIMFIPSLIGGAIIFVVAFILFFAFAIPAAFELADIFQSVNGYGYGYGYFPGYYEDAYTAMAIMRIVLMFLPVLLLAYAISAYVSAFITVITYRAWGHYVARYARQWQEEAN